MGLTQSYTEFMPKQDIPNSWDGLDEHRVMFEKKIGFLLLLGEMGSHEFFGSAEHKSFGYDTISRTGIKNYLESI
jgi:hypothetical protein